MKTLALAITITVGLSTMAVANDDLNDLEIAHAAYTAGQIDIRYAHLALALSENEAVRSFAETMIRDHSAVNAEVVKLARKLNVTAQDNPMSRQLLRDAEAITSRLAGLRGAAFDRAYAENELAYHQIVNGVVEDAFVPNVENREVREAFQTALGIFRGHERHAERMVEEVTAMDRER